jgi:spore germination protein YaaH
LQEVIDPYLYWDEPTRSVIVTTKDKVLRMPSEQLTAFLNQQPIHLQVPVREVDGIRYVPLEPIEKLYGYAFVLLDESGVLSVEKDGYAVQQARVTPEEGAVARAGASRREPIVASLDAGETVDLLGEENGWYRVFTSSGIVGFVPKDLVELTKVRQVNLGSGNAAASVERTAGWKPLGGKIGMVWEHVVSRNPNTADIGPLPGVNVVSPTWFELKDGEGTLLNKADPAYVTWAHQRGYQVWGLVTNGFNPDWTASVLSSYEKREKLVSQLLYYAHLYDLDGINIDFENVYLADKERLVQFVRELTPYLHEQGLTVSIDVTIKSTAENWSMFLDRAALAEVVDYVAVMTYDEHWAASPKAGSVASLPWTEKGLQGVLEEVPARKLLLGVPFYTRLWTEEKQSDGTTKVSSRAFSMSRAREWIAERNLTPVLDEASGQHYVEYADPHDGKTYKMWIEDTVSMEKRIQLVEKYNLAGVAAWRRGFEVPEIWTIIEAGLEGK